VKLSGTYRAQGGETWSDVARRTTGNDLDANAIKRANPAIQEPIEEDFLVQIPMGDFQPSNIGQGELVIQVDGYSLGTLDNFEMILAIDAISKCSFSVPNEPETRAMFLPLQSQRITVDHLGDRLFTGRCASPQPQNAPNQNVLNIEAYADPGILELCSPSIEKFPLEWKNSLLEQIAEDLCDEHGIAVKFKTPTSSRFKRVDIAPGQNILGFLSDLSSQRGLILTSDASGTLLIHTGSSNGPIVSFLQNGKHPTENIDLTINEDKYFSSVTGIVPPKSKRGKIGAKYTVQNPHATSVVRSHTFECKDIDKGELETAVQSTAGRMFAEVISCSVDVATWNNDMGSVYKPGQLVSLQSTEDFIPDAFTFLVTMVTLRKSAGNQSASLNLALPGVYSGELPERLPWQ
jgi:prophage tail gpP-like protein